MSPYRHIFFDLDRTIWDFDRNSSDTLEELFYKYGLARSIADPQDFVRTYHGVNLQLWELYRKGEMTKHPAHKTLQNEPGQVWHLE